MFANFRLNKYTFTTLMGLTILGIILLVGYKVASASSDGANSEVIDQVTNQGVTVSISSVVFEQDQTKFVACFDLPSKTAWLPHAVLIDGSTTIVNSKYTILNWQDPKTFEGTYRCYQYTFFGKASPATRFVIEKIQTDIPELLTQADCDRALVKIKMSHADFSFSCKFGDHGIGFDIQKPTGMTSDEAGALITDALTETVTGPWNLQLSRSSQTYSPTQTGPTLTTTRGSETPVSDPISSPAPSNSALPDYQPIAPVVTHGGISIAITWAYADLARIGIEYYIRGVKIPEGYQLFCPVRAVTLKDDLGKEYEKYTWPSDERPSENFEIQCKKTGNENDYIVTQSYYGTPADHIQSLGLTLSIDLGGFDIYTQNGTMKEFPKYEPFTFYFDVPITSSLTLDPNLTQSKNGMEVTLTRLAINPTLTDAYLCISYDNHKGWYPEMTLTWEGKTYKADETSWARMDVYHKSFPTFMSQFTSERCYRYSFFLPYQANPGDPSPRQMVVSLNKVTINAMDALSQEECSASLQEVQRSYPGLDFSCNIHTSDIQGFGPSGISINKMPPEMDQSTAYEIAEKSFKSIVEGPFIFTVNIP